MITWLAAFIALAGAFGLTLGLLTKAGRYRYWARWYSNPTLPLNIRNGIFGSFPIGLGSLFVGTGLFLTQAGSRLRGWATAALALALICWAEAALVILRPPRLLKPGWLLEEEGRRSPLEGPPHAAVVDRVQILVIVLACLIGAALLIGAVLMD